MSFPSSLRPGTKMRTLVSAEMRRIVPPLLRVRGRIKKGRGGQSKQVVTHEPIHTRVSKPGEYVLSDDGGVLPPGQMKLPHAVVQLCLE